MTKDVHFDKDHPWRANINSSEYEQNQEIAKRLAAGTLTPAEAKTLRGVESKILAQEIKDANGNHNGAHLHLSQKEALDKELAAAEQRIQGTHVMNPGG